MRDALAAISTDQVDKTGDERAKKRQKLCQTEDVLQDPVTMVKGWTCVTSVWGNGARGPFLICAPEGVIPQAIADRINKEYKGRVLIISSRTEATHFMSSETVLDMFEGLFTPAYKLQREACGMMDTSKYPGGMLTDACSSHHST